jgi:hypothetical protein
VSSSKVCTNRTSVATTRIRGTGTPSTAATLLPRACPATPQRPHPTGAPHLRHPAGRLEESDQAVECVCSRSTDSVNHQDRQRDQHKMAPKQNTWPNPTVGQVAEVGEVELTFFAPGGLDRHRHGRHSPKPRPRSPAGGAPPTATTRNSRCRSNPACSASSTGETRVSSVMRFFEYRGRAGRPQHGGSRPSWGPQRRAGARAARYLRVVPCEGYVCRGPRSGVVGTLSPLSSNPGFREPSGEIAWNSLAS